MLYNFEIYKIPIPFYMDDVGLVAYLQGCLMYIVVRRYDTKSATASMLFYYHLWLYVSDSDCPLYIQKLNQLKWNFQWSFSLVKGWFTVKNKSGSVQIFAVIVIVIVWHKNWIEHLKVRLFRANFDSSIPPKNVP